MKTNFTLALLLAVSSLAVPAQQPRVVNTQFRTEQASSGLSATVDRFQRSTESVWVGYAVAALPGTRVSHCSDWQSSSQAEDGCCGEFQLEGSGEHISSSEQKTEQVSDLYVLLRFDHGTLIKIRSLTPGCRINAGGIAFDWLTGVQPEESAEFLGKVAGKNLNENNRLMEDALVTLSMHATPRATAVLASLAAPSQDLRLREKAAFWLGAQRGHEGFLALQKLAVQDMDAKFREKLTFDFSVNSDPGAVDQLLQMAKSDADPGVRGQAIFWIAQKAGKKAASAITDAVENDPDTAVKKKAVFALSQLPKEEGVPQLMHVADTNSNPVIRKEAIFWLGESKDPRALDYLEAILKR